MQTPQNIIDRIQSGAYDRELKYLYHDGVDVQKRRYTDLLAAFEQRFGADREISLFSAPGRTELCGNHTDHQRGCVLAASVTLDTIAIVSKRNDSKIVIYSEGYGEDNVDISDLDIKPDEVNNSQALIRGCAAGFAHEGFHIGGFDAYTTSNVLKGAGLSSSAAFEVLLGTILSHLYNEAKIDPVKIAQIGQYAENVYFKKPCGLMDQTASSVGGIIAIDFENSKNPKVTKIDYEFSAAGYTLCIVDAGGSHADLSPEYAAIPEEMKSVAACFGKEVLREVDRQAFEDGMGALRQKVSDRALLRAIHFFDENARVLQQTQALDSGDIEQFKALMVGAGRSSALNLQNCYPICRTEERSVALALALSEQLLEGKGAWRIHGGGFAGTILCLVPNEMTKEYSRRMEAVFGEGSCHVLYVRPAGGYKLRGEAFDG